MWMSKCVCVCEVWAEALNEIKVNARYKAGKYVTKFEFT